LGKGSASRVKTNFSEITLLDSSAAPGVMQGTVMSSLELAILKEAQIQGHLDITYL
jgi:hypothetical protein